MLSAGHQLIHERCVVPEECPEVSIGDKSQDNIGLIVIVITKPIQRRRQQ